MFSRGRCLVFQHFCGGMHRISDVNDISTAVPNAMKIMSVTERMKSGGETFKSQPMLAGKVNYIPCFTVIPRKRPT